MFGDLDGRIDRALEAALAHEDDVQELEAIVGLEELDVVGAEPEGGVSNPLGVAGRSHDVILTGFLGAVDGTDAFEGISDGTANVDDDLKSVLGRTDGILVGPDLPD